MKIVKVRYGPSPTGIPHVGNIRTALFNYLFAKNQGGKFYLRIEDTDKNRIVAGAVEKIKESLKTLGLTWDGDVIFQSKRLEIYKKHLQMLTDQNLAYQDEGAWRFKVNTKNEKESWQDIVYGHIEFPTKVIEDFVIIKSDGFPTYHFASVVDDHLMEITHVMRGDEWISSTPKHLQLYKAFGWQPPAFVHLPPVTDPNKKKLSKREGAKSVMEYTAEGYLPEALVNFLVLLGWSPKSNQEIFSLEELIKGFSLDRINKNSPIFNLEKLDWFNGEWIKKLNPKEFDEKIQDEFPKTYSSAKTRHIAPLVQSRLVTLKDFPKIAGPFYKKPTINKATLNSAPLSGATISNYAKKLANLNIWTPDDIRMGTISFSEEENVDRKDLYRCLGVATFGKLVTPPLPEAVTVIGQKETLDRLNDLAKKKK